MVVRASSAEGQRFLEACELHDIGLEMMRQRLRREHPTAGEDVIEKMVRTWLSDRPYDAPGHVVAWPRP